MIGGGTLFASSRRSCRAAPPWRGRHGQRRGRDRPLVRAERERVLQMFVIATLVSIGLSLVLASTIANPLADLAAAAELGRDATRAR